MEPLTDRQSAMYELILTTIEQEGRQPTIRELADFIGSSSPNAAVGYLNAMQKKGWIQRRGFHASSIRLVGVTFKRQVASIDATERPVECKQETAEAQPAEESVVETRPDGTPDGMPGY